MADLSQVQSRPTAQNRITNNRQGVLPSRRDTDAPQRRVFADIRNATTSSGKADILRDVLASVQGAAKSGQQLANDKWEKDQEIFGAQGEIDEAAGHVDAELMRKSLGYRQSVSTRRAQRVFFSAAEQLDDDLKNVVYNQTDADPTKRAAEINAVIDAHMRELVLDPETGKPRDFGSPAAAKWMAAKIAEQRADVTAKAMQMVEDRMGEENITDTAEALRSSIRAGTPITLDEAMTGLLPTVDHKKAKDALLLVVKDEAYGLRDQAAELDDTDPQRAAELRAQSLGLIDGLLGHASTPRLAKPEAAPADPSAPLPDGQDAAPTTAAEPQTVSLVAPFQGFGGKPSSKMGEARQGGSAHNGEDFPVPIGTVVKAPADGEVIASFRNQRGGNQVRVKLADGTIVGFAHLSARDVKVGDKVKAGQQLALSGNTGRSSGPHVHMTVEQHGRKVSPSDFFKGGAITVGGGNATSTLAQAMNRPSGSEQAEALVEPGPVASPQGGLALTPTEVAEFRQLRRQLKTQMDADDKEATGRKQNANEAMFLGRLYGMGSYPTPTEIQKAVQSGDISLSGAIQLFNGIEADQRQERTDQRELKADENQARQDSVDDYANRVLAPLLSGKYRRGAQTAQEELAKLLPTIADREVRQAVFREVSQGINAHVDLRNATPEYRKGMGTFDEWEATYTAMLGKQFKVPPELAGRAPVMVKNKVNQWRVALGQYGKVDPSRVQDFMDRAEKDLDAYMERTFRRSASNR